MADALPQPPPAIVITGQALPEAKAERVYAVEKIGRPEIDHSPSDQIDQLLKEVPGIELFRRSDARSGHPTSQGVTLRALGGNASSRVLLVLDGVPQTDPFGGWVNWPAYDPSSLDSIRVVRGGGSVAYGPGALAGTIEMTSRTGAGESGELDFGNRASTQGRAALGIGIGRGVLNIFGRAGASDGFVPITSETRGAADRKAPYEEWSSRARLVTPLGGSTELQAGLLGFHDWRTRGTDFSADRTNGWDASLALVGRGRWQWRAVGYWQWRDLRSSSAILDPSRARATPVLLQYSVPSHGLGGSFEIRPPLPRGIELRFGADARATAGETRELFNYVAGEPTRRRHAGGKTLTGGAFIEASADVGGLVLSAGGRVDRWEVGAGHLREETISSQGVLRSEHDRNRTGWLPTARGGLLAPVGGEFAVRAAAYLGWRMPTLNELFRPFRAGLDATAANPELVPERLAGTEIGIEYEKGPWRLSATAFVNRLTNAIANVTLGRGPATFGEVGFVGADGTFRKRENIDALSVSGIELGGSWASGPWTVRAGASFSRARMKGGGEALFLNGLRPAQTPSFAGTLSIAWEHEGKSLGFVLRRVGSQFEDDLNLKRLKAATTFDAFASWPLKTRLQLVVRAENVTNALVIAGIGGDGAIERATPRTLWLGLRVR